MHGTTIHAMDAVFVFEGCQLRLQLITCCDEYPEVSDYQYPFALLTAQCKTNFVICYVLASLQFCWYHKDILLTEMYTMTNLM